MLNPKPFSFITLLDVLQHLVFLCSKNSQKSAYWLSFPLFYCIASGIFLRNFPWEISTWNAVIRKRWLNTFKVSLRKYWMFPRLTTFYSNTFTYVFTITLINQYIYWLHDYWISFKLLFSVAFKLKFLIFHKLQSSVTNATQWYRLTKGELELTDIHFSLCLKSWDLRCVTPLSGL